NQLRFEPELGTGGLKPYLHVRRGSWAKVRRSLFFDLLDLGGERQIAGRALFGVASSGAFFPMAPAGQGEGLLWVGRPRGLVSRGVGIFFSSDRGGAGAEVRAVVVVRPWEA